MTTIEFQAQVKNGTIEIPEAYRNEVTDIVQVIIRTHSHPEETGILAQLLAHPVDDPTFTPMTRDEVYADRIRS